MCSVCQLERPAPPQGGTAPDGHPICHRCYVNSGQEAGVAAAAAAAARAPPAPAPAPVAAPKKAVAALPVDPPPAAHEHMAGKNGLCVVRGCGLRIACAQCMVRLPQLEVPALWCLQCGKPVVDNLPDHRTAAFLSNTAKIDVAAERAQNWLALWRARPNIMPGRDLTVDDCFHVLEAMHHFSTTQRVSRALKHLESLHGWVVGGLVRAGLRDKLKEMWLSWLGRKKTALTAVRTSVAAEIQRLVR